MSPACLLQTVPDLTQEHTAAIYGLFDAHVDAGLAWVRKEGSEYISSVDNNLTTSLALIMQVGGVRVVALYVSVNSIKCCYR